MSEVSLLEIANRIGVSKQNVKTWVAKGDLKTTRRLGKRGVQHFVSETDLEDFLASHHFAPKDPWTDVDTDMLIELLPTCTAQQIAKYLGRGVNSVNNRIAALKRQGVVERVPKTYSQIPFHVTKTSILIAKTCAYCGKLRDARFYSISRTGKNLGQYGVRCFICSRGSGSSEKKRESNKAAQLASEKLAERRGFSYTDDEIKVIEDTSKTAFQVAIELKRTLAGVHSMRAVLGVRRRRPRGLLDSHWLLDFPNAEKALAAQQQREKFIRLGVPDDQWDDVA